jgi:ATP-binding cassette subfamily F protein 3
VSLVVLEGISLGFGGRTLFAGANLRIGENERVGLVGRNGSGKSSLLKIIAGSHEPAAGVVRSARGVRIGYLPQEATMNARGTLLESVLASVPGKNQLEAMLAEVEAQLASAVDHDDQLSLAQKLADLHEELAGFEATYSRHEAQSVLVGLGFHPGQFETDRSSLSGGWRTRAMLAGLLFQKPDLLLLDEPTNHLDGPSVAWLAGFLRRHRAAFVLVCHDREFLDEQIDRVVAIEPDGIRQYAGNYAAYLEARVGEMEILERRAANLERQRDAARRFIRRFRAQASKARAVQSRIKALDRLEEITLPSGQRGLAFRFPPSERSGTDVATLKDLGHCYGDHEVFSDVNLVVRRAERIAVVGANGNGKTTLLRHMAGVLAPTRGSVAIGHNVRVAYHGQHVAALLDDRVSVFEEVWRDSAVQDVSFVRGALGTMLFSGSETEKAVGVLSGGEKARVALAKLLVHPGNFMILDEPTNHLDLDASEALGRALETFDGTLIFVSHNRSFVGRLATRIWSVASGRVEEFPGTFEEYLHRCQRLLEPCGGEVGAPVERGESGGRRLPARAVPRPGGKPVPKRTLERRIQELEERIGQLENAQAARGRELSIPETYADQAHYHQLLGEYRRDADKLEELMARWERAQEELGALVGEQ